MPTYTFRCTEHGDWDAFLPFAEFDTPQICPECGGELRRVFSIPRIAKSTLQHEARWDYNLGGVVSSQQDRDELLKRKSEEAGTTLVWTDPNDMKGATEEGIEEKKRTLRPSTTRYL